MSKESEKFTGILKMVQLNPVPVFGTKKKKVNLVEYNSWTHRRKPTKRNFSIVVTIAHLDLKCAYVSGINLN